MRRRRPQRSRRGRWRPRPARAAAVGVPLMLIADDGLVLAAGVVLVLCAVGLGCAATLPAATAGER